MDLAIHENRIYYVGRYYYRPFHFDDWIHCLIDNGDGTWNTVSPSFSTDTSHQTKSDLLVILRLVLMDTQLHILVVGLLLATFRILMGLLIFFMKSIYRLYAQQIAIKIMFMLQPAIICNSQIITTCFTFQLTMPEFMVYNTRRHIVSTQWLA